MNRTLIVVRPNSLSRRINSYGHSNCDVCGQEIVSGQKIVSKYTSRRSSKRQTRWICLPCAKLKNII